LYGYRPPDFYGIYIDTNPLLGAEWPGLSGERSNIIYGARRWWGIPTFLPRPVIVEAEEHWVREVQAEVSRLEGA
jgi:hypothetical protein